MKLTPWALALSCLLPTSPLFARDPVDVSLEITTKPGETKQDAFDQATEEATRKMSEDLVGPEKLEPAWAHVKAKLLKNSARYVLFIRGSAPVDSPEGQKVTVQMGLAPDALESLLREFGLFNGASVRVLPLISVTEGRGSRYAWWADGNDAPAGLAQEYFKRVVQQLNQSAKGKSIYIMDPLVPSLRVGIPSSYRTETLRHEDQMLLAQYLKADVVLDGRVEIGKAAGGSVKMNVAFDLWQARSGRALGEVSRAEQVPGDQPKVVGVAIDQSTKRAFTELATKLVEASTGGGLNLNQLRLSVEGALSFRQQTDLRKQLGELREIRSLRERLFEPGRVTYEIDTPLPGPELGKTLQRARFAGFTVGVDDVRAEGLVLNVRPVPSGR